MPSKKTMTANGSETGASLSLDDNPNYTQLAKHIVWLEKRCFIKSTIEGDKINVKLTERGKVFVSTISAD
jgi:predicted transcriptional regulator